MKNICLCFRFGCRFSTVISKSVRFFLTSKNTQTYFQLQFKENDFIQVILQYKMLLLNIETESYNKKAMNPHNKSRNKSHCIYNRKNIDKSSWAIIENHKLTRKNGKHIFQIFTSSHNLPPISFIVVNLHLTSPSSNNDYLLIKNTCTLSKR